MRLILLDNGLDVDADRDEKYKMVISASNGEIRFTDIKDWIQTKLRKKSEP